MEKRVSALKARTNLGEILNEVYYKGREVVIERKGLPVVRITRFEADLNSGDTARNRAVIARYAGVFADIDAEAMKARVRRWRRMPARAMPLSKLHG